MKKKMKDQRGFTLIEIIAVLVILAILAVVAVPKYLDMATEAKNKAAMGAVAEGMGRVNQAIASYMLQNAGANPTPAAIVGLLANATDAGDFTLSYEAGTGAVNVTASGTAGNASGGTASGVVKLPQ